MFTGIISHLGKVTGFQKNVFTFDAPQSFSKLVKKGDSIAVNGVCLTAISDPGRGQFKVEVMPETLKRTALGDLKKGHIVNLELAMKATDRFAGHLVLGHVDGVATIKSIEKKGNSRLFIFKAPKRLGRYIVEKGSIAVNGISLTIIDAKDQSFVVGIIPYTWHHTMLSKATVGDRVNIEVDILAKYLEKLVKSYK